MIAEERLDQLIAFTSALVEANKQGVYEVPLMAVSAEALDVLTELKRWRHPLHTVPDAA